MHMAHKQILIKEKREAYWKGNKKKKGEILDAVVEITGMTRKGVIKCFRRQQTRDPCQEETRGRPVIYTPDCIAALKELWEMSSESCGENLHPLINEYIAIQIREKDWKHSSEATEKLRKMSLGSVKKYVGAFVRIRRNFGGKSTTTKSAVISMVPIRMDGWKEAETGVTQVDTVAHCGCTVAGDVVYTVNATDIRTLWGTRRAQWNKGQEATKTSLEMMRADSPFPWTELHPDSGKEFINAHCITYATSTNLRMTRSRPYHKNDNCFVEERNGHVVRVYVGFERLDTYTCVAALNDVYTVLTPYLNHFIASRRIVTKERVGSRWKITREKVAQTPYQRVLERPDVSEEVKTVLRKEHASCNPKQMKAEIDRLLKLLFTRQRQYGSKKK
jgi:hypothetical protein